MIDAGRGGTREVVRTVADDELRRAITKQFQATEALAERLHAANRMDAMEVVLEASDALQTALKVYDGSTEPVFTSWLRKAKELVEARS